MKVIGVIPARWGSTRLEGKILADIAGKPMIQHVFERVAEAKSLDDILIATDDKRILQACEQFGAKVVMTRSDHVSGTDRIAEAVAPLDVKYVINIQGDEPLIQANIIDDLVQALDGESMATVVKKLAAEEKDNPNVVKAEVNDDDYAVNFSRVFNKLNDEARIFKHLGIYGYSKEFLLGYNKLLESHREKEERLEQLRAIDSGTHIKVVFTNMETIGVDTLEDLEKVQRKLS